MPLFICRWPNGDFSAASAASREKAFEMFSELGNASLGEVFGVDDFMVHFTIKSKADNFEDMLPVRFAGFGEQTHRMLCERMYPAYCSAISEIDKDRPGPDERRSERFSAACQLLDEALSIERERPLGPKATGAQPKH